MQTPDFNAIAEAQLEAVRDILIAKRAEYAGDDNVLRNFELGSLINRNTPMETLLGYLTKHLVSVYDMAKSSEKSPLEKWDEKITDSITYLVLLKALAVDETFLSDEPIDLTRNAVAGIEPMPSYGVLPRAFYTDYGPVDRRRPHP